MERILTEQTPEHVGEKVKVAGWVNVVRSHGKILFIDLRDRSGFLQAVFLPNEKEVYEAVQKVRPEWVVEIIGEVVKRPDKMVNAKIPTGTVELAAKELNILNKAETLPLDVTTDGHEIGEEIRMKYRYLDIRRPRLQRNLRMRHIVIQFMREFLQKEGFVEIETPLLTKSTPEGSRDFVVPSRLHPGSFYALPQSPQQYKQLLQVAGIEKYFQVARCMRDEDPRGDRQVEHTQLDLEMSFVEQEEVMNLTERLFMTFIRKFYPEKKIQEIPFPRITYKEAMEKYNSDKPDIRKDKNDKDLLAFCWVIDFPFFEKTEEGGWTFTHNPFSAPQPQFMADLLAGKNIADILAAQYDIVLNGSEVGGGSIRNHRPEALESVFEIMGYKKPEIKEKFGHMLEAFSFGAPPHGGIAPGIDRIMSILHNEPNIREVIAFPKTGDGRDLMMRAPSELEPNQLKELHIEIVKKPAKKQSLPPSPNATARGSKKK